MKSFLFSINSTTSSRKLVFSQFDGEYFNVELKGFEVHATTRVFAYTDANVLNKFFKELGSFVTPWQDIKSWRSIERDFSIFATCTALGCVTFSIELQVLQGAPEAWMVMAGLSTDFGQLEQIAKNSESFFNG